MAKSKENRYSGTDSQSWYVVNVEGKKLLNDSFPGFGPANDAARQYNRETGELASAVRS